MSTETTETQLAALAVGRSAVRRRILELLLEDTAARYHLREIQRRAGTTPGTASRELAWLVGAGLVERTPEGHQVYFRASRSPIVETLRRLRPAAADEAAPLSPALPDPAGIDVARRFAAAMRIAGDYPDRLVAVGLFGSRARGDHRPGADANVVVVLDSIGGYAAELELTSTAAAAVALETGIALTRIFVSAADWANPPSPALRAIRDEALPCTGPVEP